MLPESAPKNTDTSATAASFLASWAKALESVGKSAQLASKNAKQDAGTEQKQRDSGDDEEYVPVKTMPTVKTVTAMGVTANTPANSEGNIADTAADVAPYSLARIIPEETNVNTEVSATANVTKEATANRMKDAMPSVASAATGVIVSEANNASASAAKNVKASGTKAKTANSVKTSNAGNAQKKIGETQEFVNQQASPAAAATEEAVAEVVSCATQVVAAPVEEAQESLPAANCAAKGGGENHYTKNLAVPACVIAKACVGTQVISTSVAQTASANTGAQNGATFAVAVAGAGAAATATKAGVSVTPQAAEATVAATETVVTQHISQVTQAGPVAHAATTGEGVRSAAANSFHSVDALPAAGSAVTQITASARQLEIGVADA
jgi:hypothetical protein